MLRLIFPIALALSINGKTIKDQPTSIISGDDANIEDYPYYAYLRFRQNLHCGAVIIAEDILLTAAHCLKRRDFKVYVGITTADDLASAETYDVKDVRSHPNYTWASLYDLGVIKLAKNLTFSSKVKPIKLATEQPKVNDSVAMVGFGKPFCEPDTSDWGWKPCPGPASQHLKSAVMKVIRVKDSGTFHTENGYQNTCFGDSGGPVVYDGKLVGLISTGQDNIYCTGYSIQAPIVPWLSWIQEQINALNSN